MRSSGDIRYLAGDTVFYKRENSSAWHGPGKVLGQDGQQILIKHGSYCVRAHPCRVRLVQETLVPATQKIDKPITPTLPEGHSTPENRTPPLILSKSLPTLPSNNQVTTRSITVDHNLRPDMDDTNMTSNAENNVEINVENTTVRSESNLPQQTVPFKIQPRQNDKYINKEGQPVTSKIDNRAGKVKGQYPNWWNTTRADGTEEHIDFAKVTPLKLIEEQNNVEDTFVANTKKAIRTAKFKELENWKSQLVYSEAIPNDQEIISLRRVCTPKVIDGVPSIKARLVAKGFQEQEYVRGDSPTCSREGVKISLALVASQSCTLKSLDISTAFL